MKRKLAFAAAVFTATVVALPAVAGAHVEIASDSKLGGDGTITGTLTIPNECVKSDTTSLDLNFPKTPALTKVDVTTVANWTTATTTDPTTQAVTKIAFTGSLAGSDQVKFPLTFSGVPAGTESVSFTALQNCSNGDVIRWVQPTPAGGAEPEFPAPMLAVAQTSTKTPEASTETKVPVTTTKRKSDDSLTGVVIGVVAASLVLIGAGVVMFRRSKK